MLLWMCHFTWLKIMQTSHVGGVLESSGPPLDGGALRFFRLKNLRLNKSQKRRVQFLSAPSVIDNCRLSIDWNNNVDGHQTLFVDIL